LLIRNPRTTQVHAAIQNIITFNSNIQTSTSQESARKTFNDFFLHTLLNQTLTQSAYQQILSLSQQSVSTIGLAVSDAAALLAPCDRAQYNMNIVERDNSKEQPTTLSQDKNGSAKIIPNPTSGICQLILPEKFEGLANIHNNNGKRIRTIQIIKGQSVIDLDFTGQSAGLYWVSLLDQNGQIVSTSKVSVVR
jgi:hypothetical protein